MIGELARYMGIEETRQGIREYQPVIDLLRHLFVKEGAMAFAKGCAQGVRFLVISHFFDGAGLNEGHQL